MQSRVIYMGTPDFAVPALERLAARDDCDLSLVVTQPDRPAGRGKRLVSPAVKLAADRLEVPVMQTATLRVPEVRQRIIELQPDLIVVAAFGMILGRWILELPTHGCVNLHASLLPKYRGANPIASAIAAGESTTGITLMRMDRGLDTGPVYATSSIPIGRDDTTASLTPRLADVAGDLLDTHLDALLKGAIQAVPQGPDATLTRMMTKDDGWIDFSRPAIVLERHIRAMWPWPRAWTTSHADARIQIHKADVSGTPVGGPGEVVHLDGQVHIGTGNGSMVLRRVQLPGGKPIEGAAIVQSRVFQEGAILGKSNGPEDVVPLVLPATFDPS